jgi:hypothetical protein
MHEYNRISYEAHDRARRREREAAAERIARHARASRRRRRLSILGTALRHLRPGQQANLEAESDSAATSRGAA